jgi:hypothetical protein
MPFRVRRRSPRDGSRETSLPRCSGGWLALTACPLGVVRFRTRLRGFPAPDHPVRSGWIFGPASPRDGPRELLCLLWPLVSGLGRAVRSRSAVSRGRSCTGCERGTTPSASTRPAPGRARARPPRRWTPPPAGGETCIAAALARCRASLPGRSSGCPAAGWISWWAAAHRCAATGGVDTGISLVPAGNPCCRRTSSSVRSLGAEADIAGARPRFPGFDPLRPNGATRPTCSARVGSIPHLGGLLRAPVPRLLHLVPALAPLPFPPRAPADRTWLPSCAQ